MSRVRQVKEYSGWVEKKKEKVMGKSYYNFFPQWQHSI
jgi:hypothetical protein